jgi:hypothetical protein
MDDCFKPATQCNGTATRMTAAERQFERFVSAVQQFGCDDGASRFEEMLAKLVAAGPVSAPARQAASAKRGQVAAAPQ